MELLSDQAFKKLQELVKRYTGITMNDTKRSLLSNRIRRRFTSLGLPSFEAYIDLLEHPKTRDDEIPFFIDQVTTNETYFFRSKPLWDDFFDRVLPEWLGKNPIRNLKLWCGAASSGEEPYTIAMYLKSFQKKHSVGWSLLSTDISQEMIERCKQGIYTGRSIEKIAQNLLKENFDKLENGAVQVNKELKQGLRFQVHDLLKPPPITGVHIAFVRNVMIYFDKDTKDQVLSQIAKALLPGGLLVVGESEGLVGVDNRFEYIRPSVYRKEATWKS